MLPNVDKAAALNKLLGCRLAVSKALPTTMKDTSADSSTATCRVKLHNEPARMLRRVSGGTRAVVSGGCTSVVLKVMRVGTRWTLPSLSSAITHAVYAVSGAKSFSCLQAVPSLSKRRHAPLSIHARHAVASSCKMYACKLTDMINTTSITSDRYEADR